MTAHYVEELREAAEAAERAEAEFRRYAERRLDTMTAERVRAHRRYHLVSGMVERARSISERAVSIAAQITSVLGQTGWSEGDAAYGEVCDRLGPVAALVHDDLHGACDANPTSASVLLALAVFESWYRQRFGTEFPALAPGAPGTFQPLVDF
jgi:hypothetical protein